MPITHLQGRGLTAASVEVPQQALQLCSRRRRLPPRQRKARDGKVALERAHELQADEVGREAGADLVHPHAPAAIAAILRQTMQ